MPFYDDPDEAVFYDDGAFYDDDGAKKGIMAKASLKLTRQTVLEKLSFGEQFIDKVTDNPKLPNIGGFLATLTTAQTKLKTEYDAAVEARVLAQAKTTSVDMCVDDWDAAVTSAVMHAEAELKGDRMELQELGLPVRLPSNPIFELEPPTYLVARTNGNAGVMKLNWPKVRGAKTYVIQRTNTSEIESSWVQIGLSSKSAFVDHGLTPGLKYSYRVAAYGANGQGGWSDVKTRIAV